MNEIFMLLPVDVGVWISDTYDCRWCMKITSTSHFSNDLGLDSLDTVEVVMAIEEVSHRHILLA